MPESPEVQALADYLDDVLVNREFRGAELLEFRALKTRNRPLGQLVGARVTGVSRLGKHIDMGFDRGHLVVSLGRHGWMRWNTSASDPLSAAPPALVELEFDGGVLEITDAGSWVSIGVSVVEDPREVPAIVKLGPDPADQAFTRADFDAAFGRRRKQLKAILQEQESLAGIGNAYSDEILHAAQLSPVAHAATLDDAARHELFTATTATLRSAMGERRGVPIADLKAAKVASMRVHGRSGSLCPRCGDTVRDLRFAGTTAQYCPTCQTGGVVLPD